MSSPTSGLGWNAALSWALIACPGAVGAAPRGELLYQTHCIICHTTKMHQRERSVVQDWPGLLAQVRRWQNEVSLAWGDEDIADVAHYLNRTVYHFAAVTPASPTSAPSASSPSSSPAKVGDRSSPATLP